jgi:FKBP-type peptidyl-prolyl cis-trans isomerase 2
MMSKKVWLAFAVYVFAGVCLVMANRILFAQEAGKASAGQPAEKLEEVKKAETGPAAAKTGNGSVAAGDLVNVNYTATLEDGTLVYSTRQDAAKDAGRKKVIGYIGPKAFGPQEVVAGMVAAFPGVGQSVVGMLPGERKEIKIPPESAFGPANPGKIQKYSTVKSFPPIVHMVPPEFVGRFKVFPIQGKEVQFTQFLKARVKEVSETDAALELLVKGGEKSSGEYGTVDIQRKGDEIVITLTPTVGAPFKTEGGEGRITGSDGKSFTVDFNPPLVGKSIKLDIEVTAVIRGSELAAMQVPWIDDHDKGLLAAKEAGKPAVMLLYADWCQWCKKLQSETFPDPRIKLLKDRLFFIRVNSDKNEELRKKYGQNGFPLIVLFDRNGKIAGKIDGYKDAAALREALDSLIGSGEAS